ncbi:hypothetical protein BC938DRAFT_476511 [Jimgerdemannia flammicorona]|uniref:Uncharacterized protein n=1 Tax=Jimgerdemannia flammicorona TaxID=994334 RepID=A0A433PGM3_9FUNG|nr:hypothetical protein BC938DRAFT_476511 [Jimgerdemannia flammicorona]
MPFHNLTEKDFEDDDELFQRAVSNHEGHRFRLMETTQQGLATRCLKHLVTGLEAELDSTMVASPEVVGQLLVYVQYGWPYWHERPAFSKLLSEVSARPLFASVTLPRYNSESPSVSSSAPSSPTSPMTPTFAHPLSPRVPPTNGSQPGMPYSQYANSRGDIIPRPHSSSGRSITEPTHHTLASFLRENLRTALSTPARSLGSNCHLGARATPDMERPSEVDKKKRDSIVSMEVDETRRSSNDETRATLERKRSRALLEIEPDLTNGRRRLLAEQEQISAGKGTAPYARSPVFQPPNSSLRDLRDYRRGSDILMGGDRRGSDSSMESGNGVE